MPQRTTNSKKETCIYPNNRVGKFMIPTGYETSQKQIISETNIENF